MLGNFMSRSRSSKSGKIASPRADVEMIELPVSDEAVSLLCYLQDLQMKYFPEDFDQLECKPERRSIKKRQTRVAL